MVLAAIAFVCFDMAILLLVLRSPYRNPLGAGARPVHPILRHHIFCCGRSTTLFPV